ncbi:DEP domain-containing mTOR-interacting protein-like isoform X2 [Rhopilema esculentum]|uniref:DEP domain-containing mTOR-interacting protein-like isoform X2 n=1 Tax=Rhopilema esculentum TaxID=499914 RepID=UPI0031D45234
MARAPGQILIIGEQLRLRMHEEAGLIGDRRYHFRTYTCCIVGKDAVDWMVRTKEVTSRENAVKCMRLLQDNGVLHHVCDDHVFKDEYLFYKFRVDDGTLFIEPELEIYSKGIKLHQRICAAEDSFITSNNSKQKGKPSHSFTGTELVSWLIENGETKNHTEALDLGEQLMKVGILRNVQGGIEFQEDETVYQFVFDVRPCTPLYKALGVSLEEDLYGQKLLADAVERLGLSPGKNEPFVNEDKSSRSSEDEGDSINQSGLKPVVLRHMTAEELTGKKSPYIPQNIRIMSDSVGFGFVVRGDGPCYVQTVDPSGPAASAGLKVRQYIQAVNGRNALTMNHKELAKEIMKGPMVDLVTLVHFRSISHE